MGGFGVVVIATRAANSQVVDADAVPNPGAQALPFVRLQAATPGTPDTGNYNISGRGIAGSFQGNGSLLSALNASNISTGTLADARLSNNVMLLSGAQNVTGVKTFSVAPAFAAAGAPFTVASSTLVGNLNADFLDGLSSADYVQIAANQSIGGAKSFTGSFVTVNFRLTTGAGAGRVLRSDAAGNGSWSTDGLALPFVGTGASGSGERAGVFKVSNTTTTANGLVGVLGGESAVDLAPWQEGGVMGDSGSDSGVVGTTDLGNGVGVFGITSGSNSAGAYGNSTAGDGVGVLGRGEAGDGGRFSSDSGDGVEASSTSGFAGRFTGNVFVTGDVTKRYAANTSDSIVPVAHGNVNSNGTIAGGTPNFTSSYNSTTDEYTISVTGKTIDLFFDTAVVTATTSSPVICTTSTSGGDLIVRLWTTGGARTQGRFQFIIWQPNRTDRPTDGDPARSGTVSPQMQRRPEIENRAFDVNAVGRKNRNNRP